MKKVKKGSPPALEVTEKDFERLVLKCAVPALVVFVAEWSASCSLVDGILDKLDDGIKKKNRIFKIRHEESMEIAERYNVHNFPTFLFFYNGKITDSIIGLTSPQEISRKFMNLAQKSKIESTKYIRNRI